MISSLGQGRKGTVERGSSHLLSALVRDDRPIPVPVPVPTPTPGTGAEVEVEVEMMLVVVGTGSWRGGDGSEPGGGGYDEYGCSWGWR